MQYLLGATEEIQRERRGTKRGDQRDRDKGLRDKKQEGEKWEIIDMKRERRRRRKIEK